MMLRNRSRAVGSKQALMADPCQSPTKQRPPSLFPSPRPLMALSSHGPAKADGIIISPTSILDAKLLNSSNGSPLSSMSFKKHCSGGDSSPDSADRTLHGDRVPVGLGLVGALCREEPQKAGSFAPERRMLRSGSNLRVQIPSVGKVPSQPVDIGLSPHSLVEFGLKNRDSFLAMLSPVRKSISEVAVPSPRVLPNITSPSEMEQSEEYTCVITHGPIPRTTHIFEDCIVDCCGDTIAVSAMEAGAIGKCGDDAPPSPANLVKACQGWKNNPHEAESTSFDRAEDQQLRDSANGTQRLGS